MEDITLSFEEMGKVTHLHNIQGHSRYVCIGSILPIISEVSDVTPTVIAGDYVWGGKKG